MFWSAFVTTAAATKRSIPASVWTDIVRQGKARVQERLAQGYADRPLYFNDLVERLVSEEAKAACGK